MSDEQEVIRTHDVFDSIDDHAIALWCISDLLEAVDERELDDAMPHRLAVLLHTVGYSLLKTNENAKSRYGPRD